jgi:Multicopper oxidase
VRVDARRPVHPVITCRSTKREPNANEFAKPGIVFAHGLWADGSCFSKVIPTLQADGHQVISTQNCLDSLEGDVTAVRRALGRLHSFHIHQGPFQVAEINGVPQPADDHRDIVDVPIKGEVKVVIPFTKPTTVGKFVYHCHILSHEDKGHDGDDRGHALATRPAAPFIFHQFRRCDT